MAHVTINYDVRVPTSKIVVAVVPRSSISSSCSSIVVSGAQRGKSTTTDDGIQLKNITTKNYGY